MQLLNGAIIKQPLNWLIILLMVVLGLFIVELLLQAAGGQWDCGCGIPSNS